MEREVSNEVKKEIEGRKSERKKGTKQQRSDTILLSLGNPPRQPPLLHPASTSHIPCHTHAKRSEQLRGLFSDCCRASRLDNSIKHQTFNLWVQSSCPCSGALIWGASQVGLPGFKFQHRLRPSCVTYRHSTCVPLACGSVSLCSSFLLCKRRLGKVPTPVRLH